MSEKTILCVGLVCVDIIQVCDSFPKEDTDQRCIGSRWQRGGNASNNATVLSQLGSKVEFLGTAASNLFWKFVEKDFLDHAVEIRNCRLFDKCDFPLSVVIINELNGSRTIMHSNRNLPELVVDDFKNLKWTDYSWIHFEGRNITNLKSIMKLIQRENNYCRVSIELEKPRKELLDLIPLADVIFIGKDFAEGMNWQSMDETIQNVKRFVRTKECVVVCAWGEKGAMAWSNDVLYESKAFPPLKIIDSLGAGDTFCAGMIHCLNLSFDPTSALTVACKLAGKKIGIEGFLGLGEAYKEICCNKSFL